MRGSEPWLSRKDQVHLSLTGASVTRVQTWGGALGLTVPWASGSVVERRSNQDSSSRFAAAVCAPGASFMLDFEKAGRWFQLVST